MSTRHPNLVRLLEPDLPEVERRRIQSHLTSCDACQAAWTELRRTSDAMGLWRVTAPDADAFVERLLASATRPTEPMPQTNWRAFALRVAAAVAIAGIAGMGAGLAIPQPSPASVAPIEPGQVVHLLGLDALSGDDTAALAHLVEPEPSVDHEEPS